MAPVYANRTTVTELVRRRDHAPARSPEPAVSPCPVCGGLQTRVVTTGPWWRHLLADLLGQDVRACARCGWVGRMHRRAATPPSPHRRRGRTNAATMEMTSTPAAHAEVDFEEIDRQLKKDR
jgi:hypothetical protein